MKNKLTLEGNYIGFVINECNRRKSMKSKKWAARRNLKINIIVERVLKKIAYQKRRDENERDRYTDR